MTFLRRSSGSGDGGGGGSGGGGGRPSIRCGAVRWGAFGGGQQRQGESLTPQQLREWCTSRGGGGRPSSCCGAVRWGASGGGQQRQRESLTPQQLREWCTSWGGGGVSSGSHSAAVQLGVPGSGVTHLQRRPRETLTPQQLREWNIQRGASPSSTRSPYVIRTGDQAGQTCGTVGHTHSCCFSFLSDTWRAEFGDETELPRWLELVRQRVDIFALDYDAILTAMYALSASAQGDCSRCVPPDPGVVAAALGASESGTPPGTAPAEALHTFTLDSGAPRCFFCNSTTLTPLPAPVPVRLADPSGGPIVASSSTVLPCPAVLSGSLSSLHLPSFSTNLVAASCSCRLLLHLTLLWHHRLGHPSLPRLRGMHSRLLVSGLPRSLPPLPPSPAPPCLPCVKGRQRAAPHSSSFSPRTAPLQTLHMDVWGPARINGQGRECYFLLVVDDYTRYTTVFPLRSKGEVSAVLIPWIRTVRLQLRERFGQDLPILRLHFDRGGEFSSDLLRDFCRGEGILQSFTLPDSPQQNGIAERRIGLVMEVAHTSMIHAAASHFLWPFVDRYAAHQLNLLPCVSLPETSPTLRWTGKVVDASVFRVWGSRAFVRDTSADKLSARAIPCDVTFDESVPFYRLFPYRSAPSPPPPLFLAPGPPPVDPLPPQAVVSGAAPGAASGGAEPEGAGSEGAGSWGAESEGAEPQGAALSRGSARASPRLSAQQLREWFVRSTHLRSGPPGAGEPRDTGAGGAAITTGAGDPTEPGAGGAGGAGAGVARAGGPGAGGAGAAGDGGAGGTVRPRPYFVPLLQQVIGVPSSTGLPPPFLCPPPDQSQPPLQPASPLSVPSPYTEESGGLTERREPASRPVSPIRTARRAPCSRPPPVPGTHTMALRPSSVPLRVPLPAPPESSLPESAAASALVAELLEFAAACCLDYASALVTESVPASPPFVGGECALGTDVLEERQEDFECLAAAVPRFTSMLLTAEGDPDAPDIPTPRSYTEAITGPYSSQWHAAMDAELASWKSTGTYVEEVPPPGVNIVDGMWIFSVKRPPGSPRAFKVRYVARGFSQRQGVDYFQTFYPTPKMTTLRVLLHVAAQRDYELHSLDFSTAFLQGSLHEEIWLHRPPGFPGLFPTSTQWSLRRPVYGLRQAPREWHDTLRTTLAALGFVPSTADPSLFLRADTSLPPFYVLVYVDDLVFATADTEALTLVKSELQKRHTCTDLGELRSYLGLQITRDRARRTITLTQSHMVHQSVEPSGPYPELVGCLMYLMTCTRPDLAYPLSLLARYVAPGRHRKVHWDAVKRVLRYLCSTSGTGLVLGGRGPVVLTGHADASWVDDSATQQSSQGYTFSLGSGSVSWRSTCSSSVLSSSCEAEIYAGAMAAQELRWLTYLLTDLGEQPRSPPVLYVDNKAMIALCQEDRLEHRTKCIALRYVLARELQQPGQLRLAYVATWAINADVFTKALPPGDHQRFVTVLGLGPPHSATPLVASPCPACRVAMLAVASPCWLSRRPALPVASPCPACHVALLAFASPCPDSRVALLSVAAPCCPRASLLAAAPPCPACASPCPARNEPPCCPHRPAAHRLAARAALLLTTLLCAALLADAPLPARCPPCATSPCPTRFSSARAPPCLRAALLVVRYPALPAMASLTGLTFHHEGRPIQFDTWLDDLHLYLQSNYRDSVSFFDHTSRASLAPPATFDSATRSHWLTRDAAAHLAVRNHLPLAERAHFGHHKIAKALYDAVVARHSSPATPALGRLIPPYPFPELSAFATVENLVTHLRTSNTR
ncbi:unnamed protein product [Closterium sp. NIES-53]